MIWIYLCHCFGKNLSDSSQYCNRAGDTHNRCSAKCRPLREQMSNGMWCKTGHSKFVCVCVTASQHEQGFFQLEFVSNCRPKSKSTPEANSFTDFMKKEETVPAILQSLPLVLDTDFKKNEKMTYSWCFKTSAANWRYITHWTRSCAQILVCFAAHGESKSRNISLPGHRCCQWSGWSPRTAAQKRSPGLEFTGHARDSPGKVCLEDSFLRWHLLENILAFWNMISWVFWYGSKYGQQPEALVISPCSASCILYESPREQESNLWSPISLNESWEWSALKGGVMEKWTQQKAGKYGAIF